MIILSLSLSSLTNMSSLWVGSVGSVSALCILYLTLVVDASKFIFNMLCFSIYNPLKDLQGTHSGHYYPLFKDTRLWSTGLSALLRSQHHFSGLTQLSELWWATTGLLGSSFFSSFIGRGGGSYVGHAILTWASTATTPCGGSSRGCMAGVCISHPGDDPGNTSRSICSSLPHHFSPESQPKPRQFWAPAGSFCSLICHPMDPVDQNSSPFLPVQFSLSSRPTFRNTHPWAFSPLCPHDQRGVQFSSILAISIK